MKNDVKKSLCFASMVERSVSLDDVRRYIEAKGFRVSHVFLSYDQITLVDKKDWDANTKFAYIAYGAGVQELYESISDIAKCLGRDSCDVLREISGEAVTLEDAFNALVNALRAGGFATEGDVLYDGETPDDALYYANEWRAVADGCVQRGSTTWLKVVHAAEDLATVALSELRKARSE